MKFLNDSFFHWNMSPEQMDRLWAHGWRHFGPYFFRYSVALQWGGINRVTPLRVDLTKFSLSRSQKRVRAKNRDLKVIIRDTFIDEIKEELFYRHRRRFKDNIPDSIYDFITDEPASVPCRNREICVYDGEKLMAASLLDVGRESTSAVYAMFEPSESRRSLGIFTILEAIRYSRELDCRYYYPGYAFRESSVYDYKKNFTGLEYLDWETSWQPYSRENDGDGRHDFSNSPENRQDLQDLSGFCELG
ncbi:MAG: arginine-tRNA-protein transferase [Acidobacteria bacterium]|nr:arginine-tRNA-protein transferase [Acidobacteriota bacterium]MCI0663914.1 arginine-tRNA-protein transferase [Acidobacteriota bacterium]